MNRSSGSSTFDSDDRLSTETYDANGNVLTTASKTFTYDSENHLMSMGSTVGLLYDGDGDRVAKTVSGVTTYYLVDDLNPTGYPQVVDELSGSGSVTRQYTYGLQRISQQQAISSTWTPSFYGYDGGGTVRALTNSAGTVTDTYEYDSFGNHWTAEGSTPNDMLYRGEEWDPDLSLLYLRARYMNPLTGRFLSMDPENGELTSPSTLHRYLYAGADGVNLVDPTGRASIAENIPILLAATAVAATGVVLFRNEVNCSYDWNGTRTGSTVYAGAFGTTAQIGPCTWQGLRQDSQPSIYPLPYPFPISTPAPSGPYGTPGGCDSGGGEQWHHIVPQAERSWAEGCGFNIDQPGLGMCIKGSCHSQIHGNSNGTNWNAEWQYQINNVWRGACPSDQQLVSFAQSLVSQFADDILCQ